MPPRGVAGAECIGEFIAEWADAGRGERCHVKTAATISARGEEFAEAGTHGRGWRHVGAADARGAKSTAELLADGGAPRCTALAAAPFVGVDVNSPNSPKIGSRADLSADPIGDLIGDCAGDLIGEPSGDGGSALRGVGTASGGGGSACTCVGVVVSHSNAWIREVITRASSDSFGIQFDDSFRQ